MSQIDYIPRRVQEPADHRGEAQARSGHDIWLADLVAAGLRQELEPSTTSWTADQAERRRERHRDLSGKADNNWLAVPATIGSQIKGPCSRIDLMKQHAGIDVQALYPAGSAPKADNWTFETYLKAAEACQKAGFAFGVGLGQTTDNVDTAGAFFHGFGAQLVNAKGDITVKTDAVRQALEYCVKVAKFYPADAPAWDDSSNNKWLVSGRGALIMNPPSAWAVAKRDAPQVAEQCWTHGMPIGPKGTLRAVPALTSGASGIPKNIRRRRACWCTSSAELCLSAWWRRAAATTCRPSRFSPPSRTWAEKGRRRARSITTRTPHNHQTLSVAAAPAPAQDRPSDLHRRS
jgi:hypothetical protein